MKRTITTTNLEMKSIDALKPARTTDLDIREVHHPTPELARFMYTAVGGDYFWVDRLVWSYDEWEEYLGRDTVRMWLAYVDDSPAGYFELEHQGNGTVELAYFGLLPAFRGKGHGGYMLTEAIRKAWAFDATRIWCHTCTLDGQHALKNYFSRGFTAYEEVVSEAETPEQTPGPWPGAR